MEFEQQRGNMELQLRALGVSAAWEHLVFTLDKKSNQNGLRNIQKAMG